MSASGGITIPQLGADSLLRSRRDYYFGPIASDDDLIVASVDPSGLTVGTALTLATAADGLLLRRARRITLTVNDDDAGGGLSVSVKVIGARWGNYLEEILTATSTDTNDKVATSVNVFDQVTSIIPLAITADSGDDLTMGIDGTSFGLDFPIDNVADVQSIINVSTNTEAAATAISSTTVQAGAPSGGSLWGGSYIKGITLATTDRWEVRYLASRKVDGSGANGVWR